MPKTSDWGETKTNKGIRITPTAWEGWHELAESLGLPMNEVMERIGRSVKDESSKKILWGVLTGLIVPMQNERASKKLKQKK